MREKVKSWLKTAVMFLLNPRLLLCIGVAWMITNGWSYIFVGVGTYFGWNWMIAVGSSYLAFLWFPFSPEKLATVTIAIFLLRLFFPSDQRTLAVLVRMKEKMKAAIKKRKEKWKKRDD